MKENKSYIYLGIIIGGLVLLFYFLNKDNTKYDWTETYKSKSTEPYGTNVLHDVLKTYYPSFDFHDVNRKVKHILPEEEDGVRKNYIFVGESLMLDTMDTNRLVEFVKQGNNALISSKTIPYDLMYFLYKDEDCIDQYWDDYSFSYDSLAQLNFSHPNLKIKEPFNYRFFTKNRSRYNNYRWAYIDHSFICTEGFTKLGFYVNTGQVNFVRKKVGAGHFYLHTTPLAFTNFQLIDSLGIDYANRVLSHLLPGDIYWDSFNHEKEEIGRHRNNLFQNPERKLSTENPLKYVLSQTSLAWAWYLSLLLSLLFLGFRAKRKQKPIPILPENKNSSLAFISSIGSLYFLQNDHRKLCNQKMRLFRNFVRERYNISTKEIDQNFINKLSIKSEVAAEDIEKIFSTYSNIEQSTTKTSEELLIKFHRFLEKFYKTCK